jgi:hypothetical protein
VFIPHSLVVNNYSYVLSAFLCVELLRLHERVFGPYVPVPQDITRMSLKHYRLLIVTSNCNLNVERNVDLGMCQTMERCFRHTSHFYA